MLKTKQVLENLSREDLLNLLTKALGEKINRTTIDELYRKHDIYLQALQFSSYRIENYFYAKRNFREYCGQRGIQYTDEITADHADEFYSFLRGTKTEKTHKTISENNAILQYKAAKAMFEFAANRNYLPKNPFRNINLLLGTISNYWTPEYFEKLIQAIREHQRRHERKFFDEMICRILYTTGLRIGLLMKLKRNEIIFHGDRIYITTKRKIAKSAAMQTHTSEIINEKAKEMFRAYTEKRDKQGIEPEDYIFITSTCPRTEVMIFRCRLKSVTRKAGIQYLHPHCAKHGFITMLALKGYTAKQICTLTGNTTTSLIDQRYTHISAEMLRDRTHADLAGI